MRQASLAARECLSAWIAGFPLMVWYDLRDDGDNPFEKEHNYGLLTQKYEPKPALAAIEHLRRAAVRYGYSGMVDNLPAGAHALRLETPQEVLFATWNDDNTTALRVRVPRGPLLGATDMLGRPVAIPETNPDGSIELDLPEISGPVYLRFSK
jgi:hypothetical protein